MRNSRCPPLRARPLFPSYDSADPHSALISRIRQKVELKRRHDSVARTRNTPPRAALLSIENLTRRASRQLPHDEFLFAAAPPQPVYPE